MPMKTVKCRICDKECNIKQLAIHISRKHKMKYVEYAKQYWKDLPNWSPCKNEGCDEVCKDTYCSKQCMSEGFSRIRKGVKLPPRTKEQIRKISEAAKERFKDPTNHPMYGKTHSEEAKQKMSQAHKERLKDPTNHPLYGTVVSDEVREKISKSQKEYYKYNDSPFKGKTHTPETIRKIFKNRPMNKLEKLVANHLDGLGLDYHFQFFITEDGVCKSYDFKLKDSPYIIEVHGDYWHGGDGVDKHVFNVDENIENDEFKKQIAESRGYEVIVIWESEIKDNPYIINETLSKYNII